MWYMNEEREMLQKAFREFAQTRVRAHVAEMEENDADSKDLIKEMGKLGFNGLVIPEEYGGAGVDYINYGLLIEELGKESLTFALLAGIVNAFNRVMLFPGACTEEQLEKYLKPAVKGDIVIGCAGTEATGASWHDGYQTTAVREGDEWVINGGKVLITQADVADYFMVTCRTKDHVDVTSPDPGLEIFFISANAPGFSVGHIENKVGLNGSRTGAIYFDNVRVSEADRLRTPMAIYGTTDQIGFYGIADLGAAEALIEKSVAYMKNRVIGGVSLWDAHESSRSDIGRLVAKVNVFRNGVYGYLANMNEGDIKQTFLDCPSLKIEGNKLVKNVADECIHLCGGTGVIYETGLERYYRDAIVFSHTCGSDKSYINRLSASI